MKKEDKSKFTYEEIYPIAMIQVPEVLEADIKELNSSLSRLTSKFPNISKQDIWIAYERCGYNVKNISEYISSGKSLELLPFHVKPKEYNTLSPCRREAIRSMYSNTNTYFYRNRPPGEEPAYGKWTEEEQIAFHDRLMLFEHFGIADKHWGIFAVKTKRFGYSCSQYFKKQYNPNKFKDRPLPEFPDIPPSEILDWLKNEAFEYIKSCILKAATKKDAVIKSGTRSKAKRANEKHDDEDQESQDTQEESTSMEEEKVEEIKEMPIKEEKEEKRISSTSISSESDESAPVVEKAPVHRSEKYHYDWLSLESTDAHMHRRKHRSIKGRRRHLMASPFPPLPNECSINLALGAKDQVTGQPMKHPMVNRDGYVLDKGTWEQIISGKVYCPFDVIVYSIDDLMELTNENFNKYKPYLINVAC